MSHTPAQADLDHVRVQRARAQVCDAQGRTEDAELYRLDADLAERLANCEPKSPEHTEASQEYARFRNTWRTIRDQFGTHQLHGKIEGVTTVDDIKDGD